MKILVCIKQVIDTDTQLTITPGACWLPEGGDVSYRLNRYDDYALEEALLLKEKFPDVEIHVISVGPDRVTQVIRRALSKGADRGVHIACDTAPLAALATATFIAHYAGNEAFDLILTGVMSEDAMQCQVGPLLATLLCLPCAVSVISASLAAGAQFITVRTELEGMLTEKVDVSLPAVLTIQTGGNTPRYPSLSNIMRAREKTVLTLNADDMTTAPHREEFLPLAYPAAVTKGIILEGTSDGKAERLLDILHERSIL